MAKTIGKLELKNIFLRPVAYKDNVKVLLKFSYRPRETEDVENELTLEEAFDVLKEHLRNPFFFVLHLRIKINFRDAIIDSLVGNLY